MMSRKPFLALVVVIFFILGAWVAVRYFGSDSNRINVDPIASSGEALRSTGVGVNKPDQIIEPPVAPDLDAAYADKVSELPPHPWQLQRRDRLRQISMVEAAGSLDDLQDQALAESSLGGGMVAGYYNPDAQRLVVTRLHRVRKLLTATGAEREAVVPLLLKNLAVASEKWHPTFLTMKFADTRTPEMEQAVSELRLPAVASAYLLGEYQEKSALPILFEHLNSVASPDRDSKVFNPSHPPSWASPVPATLALYAAHRIVVSLNGSELNATQRSLRDRYLSIASDLPPIQVVEVTAWDSAYSESDPQGQIIDPQGKLLERESMMSVAVYPSRTLDSGELLVDEIGLFGPAAKQAYLAMGEFVESLQDNRLP